MHLGIDFGTTNSSVARFDGSQLLRLSVDSANDNPHVLPSLIYVDRAHHSVVGMQAASEYLHYETGRPVIWEEKRVGEIDIVNADMSFVETVHIMVDTAAHGRLLQYIKTGLRDPNYQGTQIFNRFYTVDELITLILLPLKSMAERAFGEECTGVVIGRPVRFSDDPAVTARAEEILYKAARWAGFQDIRFELEPVGATYYYHRTAPRRQTAFIFDFGGGTLDLTIAEVGGSVAPRLLATHGVLVGGDDLDKRIMQSLYKYFGGQPPKGKEAVPPHLLELLDDWQTMPILSRPENLKRLHVLRSHSDSHAIDSLRTLVTQNLGFKLFRAIEQAKIRLSDEPVAALDFDAEHIAIHETITRTRFERMIEKEIGRVEQGIRATLTQAGLQPTNIDVVLRTGGTSAVPVFASLLARIFGEEKLVQMDLLTSVVGGLAVTAHEGGGYKPRCAVRYLGKEGPWIGRLRVPPTSINGFRDVGGVPPTTTNSSTDVGGVPRERAGELYSLRVGAPVYLDSAFVVKRMPVEFSGLPTLRTAQADKNVLANEPVQFDLARPARVVIAYDASATTLPSWLKSFAPHPLSITLEQSRTERPMRLFTKDFPAGRVTLGGNRAENSYGDLLLNYLVIFQATI